ncbi:MAG: acylphosphatase [Patescibacteria group bacterium]
MLQAHIFISGIVQGVGFRYFIRSNARKLQLTGWVRNIPDGRVEAVVQGDKKTIAKLVAKCEKGPFLAEIKAVKVDWEEMTEPLKEFYFK